MTSVAARLLGLALGPEIAVVHEFRRPPYGGGNQFLLALRAELRRRGLDVGAGRIGRRTRHVLFNSFNFDTEVLRAQLRGRDRRGVRTVHRVDGPVAAYRGKDIEVDRAVREINAELADATVFQSRFSLDKHLELGLEFAGEVHVIGNAVDPSIFHPRGRAAPPAGRSRKVRIVATSWSPNRRKGADVYEWLDAHLDHARYEFVFVGNTEGTFRHIKARPPVGSAALAGILRASDVYITASINDPCSNALTEALACGLPAVYLRSGGHPEIVKEAGVAFDDAQGAIEAIDAVVADYARYQAAIEVPTIAEVADRYARVLGITA